MADFPTNNDDVIFGTSAGETIDALAGNDTIFGAGGNDTLRGNSGDDQLSGGLGLDILSGGRLGSDTAYYALAFDSVFASLELGSGYVGFGNEATDKDTFLSIENIEGGVDGDRLTGNQFANILDGNGGDDDLFGRDGGDTLLGRDGDDFLDGEGGNDLLSGGGGRDVLSGGAGDDTLKTGADDDFMEGGAGADGLDGGGGVDWIRYWSSGAGVAVDLAGGTASGGDAAGDTISNVENISGSEHGDDLSGGAAANYIEGNDGNDTLAGRGGGDFLFGGLGDDTINGGGGTDLIGGSLGRDAMRGGAGADTFQFTQAADSGPSSSVWDVIEDFQQGQDLLKIKLHDGISDLGPVTFIGTDAFQDDQPMQARFKHQNGNTIVEINVSGDAAADMRIQLTGLYTLTAADFIYD